MQDAFKQYTWVLGENEKLARTCYGDKVLKFIFLVGKEIHTNLFQCTLVLETAKGVGEIIPLNPKTGQDILRLWGKHPVSEIEERFKMLTEQVDKGKQIAYSTKHGGRDD